MDVRKGAVSSRGWTHSAQRRSEILLMEGETPLVSCFRLVAAQAGERKLRSFCESRLKAVSG